MTMPAKVTTILGAAGQQGKGSIAGLTQLYDTVYMTEWYYRMSCVKPKSRDVVSIDEANHGLASDVDD